MSSNHSCANRFGKGTDSAVPSGICPDHAFSRRGTALLSLGLTVFSWGIISTLATLPMLARDAGNSPPAVEAQLPAGPMQSKAAASCLECHEARIILQQRLGKGAWTKEVDKMMKWGSGGGRRRSRPADRLSQRQLQPRQARL